MKIEATPPPVQLPPSHVLLIRHAMQIASWTAQQVEAQAKATAQAVARIEKDPPNLPAPMAPLKVARERLAILNEVTEAARTAADSLAKVLCYTDPNAQPQDIPHLVPGDPLQAEGRTSVEVRT